MLKTKSSLFAGALALACLGGVQAQEPDAAAKKRLAVAGAAVGKAIREHDIAALERLWSPKLLVNSPGNRVLRRGANTPMMSACLLAVLKAGCIAVRTMPLTENSAEDAYRSNIQIADLNALNAVLAIGTWKRLCGFYVDQVQADHFTYSTNINEMGNSEERP